VESYFNCPEKKKKLTPLKQTKCGLQQTTPKKRGQTSWERGINSGLQGTLAGDLELTAELASSEETYNLEAPKRQTSHKCGRILYVYLFFGCYTSITTTVLDSFGLVSGSAIHVHVAWYCTEHVLKLIASSTCNLPDYKVSIIKICRTSNLDTFQIFLSAFPSS